MPQIEERVYNEQGELQEIIIHEYEGPTQEELIAQKEAELLAIYAELKALKGD
jgi:hypothetical protein